MKKRETEDGVNEESDGVEAVPPAGRRRVYM